MSSYLAAYESITKIKYNQSITPNNNQLMIKEREVTKKKEMKKLKKNKDA